MENFGLTVALKAFLIQVLVHLHIVAEACVTIFSNFL